jgi:hypothetical protein
MLEMMRLTSVLRFCGHPSTGPRGVFDQSVRRIRDAASLSPGGHRGVRSSTDGDLEFPLTRKPCSFP